MVIYEDTILMDYSSNMNIVVIRDNHKQYGVGGVFVGWGESQEVILLGEKKGHGVGGGLEGLVVVVVGTTHMKNSGDDGLSLVDPASRNPLLTPDPVSFSHLSL